MVVTTMSSQGWTDRSTPYLASAASGSPDAWTAETDNRGRKGTQQILHAGIAPASADVAMMLNVKLGSPVVERSRLVLLDECPVELATSYYPAHIGAGTALVERAKIKGGAVSLLAQLGHIGDCADEKVTARPATADEQALFNVGATEWVMCITRIVRAADGSTIQADIMTMLARERTLQYTVKIG